MPESEAKSHHVNNGKAVQSLNPQQSAWLTHWAGTRSESSTHDRDIKKHVSGVEIASDGFGSSSKGVRDVDLSMSLKKPGSQSFPFFKLGLESGRSSTSNKIAETRGVLAFEPQASHKKLTAALNVETPSRDSLFQPEAVSEIPTEQVKYHMFFGESSYSCSRPSKEKFAGSASHLSMDQGAYKLHSRTTHGPENFRQWMAALAPKEYLPNTNSTAMQQEHPAAFVSNENLNDFPKHEKSEIPSYFRQKNAPILETDPSTSSNHSQATIEDQYRRMQKHIGMGFFPHQTESPDMTRAVHLGSCSFQTVPHFVHDVEMTRMCAPLGSVEGLAGGPHSFSRTTHSLLITKQTDVKVYQDNQIFRESRVSTQIKGEAIGELNCSHPHFAHGQRGVKLQLLDSSDHESQENAEDVKAAGDVQMNGSSVYAEPMDVELFQENRLSGAFLSQQNKDIMAESKLPLGPSISLSVEKDTRGKRKIELPDMNLDLSALPAASSSMEKDEACHSRTHSFDINPLPFNINRISKSDECSDSNMGSELGSRWIKRLKLNPSNSLAHGTKTAKLAEATFHGKLNKFFTRVVEGNPYPELDKCHGNQSKSLLGKWHHNGSEMQIGEYSIKEKHPSLASLFGKGDSSSEETKQELRDITLSHSWIRRWSHNQGEIIPEPIETSKPESSKLPPPPPPLPPPEEFQKKQFPSIAAMALMGKAMTGYHQCKFQKKESFVIWNTKTFD